MPSDDGDDEEHRADRDNPLRELPPERFAGSPEEWSDLSEEAKRIEVFSITPVEDRDPSMLVPPGSSSGSGTHNPRGLTAENTTTEDGLTAATCAKIRITMNDALTAREVVESYPDLHTSKIMRHAYGECNHSTVEVPATASPQIGPDECLAMRDDYRQGDPVATVADTWARSENTVTRHIFGRCSHDCLPRDISPTQVGVSKCERVRETFEGNEKVSVREVACAMRLRKEVVATHLFDYCRHAGDNSPEVPAADPASAHLWDGRDA